MMATELDPDLRRLIDARLDVIDRILACAEMGWSERQSVVGEVETQIFELLARRGHPPTRDDVLAVLESLDPPESYIPGAMEGRPREGAATLAGLCSLRTERVKAILSRVGSVALWGAGLVVVNGILVMVIAASDGAIQWIVTLVCLAWANYAAVRRIRAWSAARNGKLLDDLRHGLAEWLVPTRGVSAT